MAITPLPTPVPSRSDPANFAERGDIFLGALPAFATEANALADDVNNKQLIASNAATTATTQAGIATAQAIIATNQAGIAANKANEAALSAASAVNAPGTNATSTTSLTIGTGNKTLTVQTGKNFVIGQPLIIASTADPTTVWMAGNTVSYNSVTGELVVGITWTEGAGTFADWSVSLTGPTSSNVVKKTGDTMSGNLTVPEISTTGVTVSKTSTTIDSSTISGQILIDNNSEGCAAVTFSRYGEYAVNFGLDNDNKLKIGGITLGSNSYEVLTTLNGMPLTGGVYTGPVRVSQDIALGSVSGTVSINFSTARNYNLTLGGNTTFNFTFPSGCGYYQILVRSNTTALRTITWPANCIFPRNVVPAPPQGTSSFAIFTIYYDGTNAYVRGGRWI